MIHKGDWAYQSLPVDVMAPGRMTVRVPVGPSFNFPTDPLGFAMHPPTDQSFSTGCPVGEPRYTETPTGRMLEMECEVVENSQVPFKPYPDYTFWIY
jgi:hypothetical protein